MCGIAGGFAFRREGEPMVSRIREAVSCINHRGPDGDGVFQNEHVSLGHKRLSIIDTSTAANQPMYSADDRYVIIFNGEIFNFQDLKDQYLSKHSFRTSSDTEVLLELFIQQGTAAFEKLRGFFALAIYDQQSDEMILARDRFGKKPFLFYQSENELVFASEMKSMISFGIPKEINWDIVSVYFQLNYIPQPYSIFKGVRKLEPGTSMRLTRSGVSLERYYELKLNAAAYNRYSYEEAQKVLVEKLDKAVELRMIADVPLGSFLSGGIDSSVVTALASRHQKHLKTFSIGYKDHPFFDETYYANLVAKKFKTEHTVFSLSNADFIEHVFAVLDHIDEPFADSSAIPEYILSYHTKKHVTVALSGDGGDEVFGGYHKHAAEYKMRQGGWKTKLVGALGPVWKVLPKSHSNRATNLFRQLNRYSQAIHLSTADRYWRWASLQTKDQALSLFSEKTLGEISGKFSDDIKKEFTEAVNGDFNQVLLADMKLVLPGDMLVKVDLMSMANSLEIRSPFIDQEVVEFAFSIPPAYKINGGIKKRIVQDAFRELLPAELYNRPKRGFEIPLRDWLRTEFRDLIENDLLNDQFIGAQGIFNVAAVRQLKNKLNSANPETSHATVWALLVFQYWWKKYFKD